MANSSIPLNKLIIRLSKLKMVIYFFLCQALQNVDPIYLKILIRIGNINNNYQNKLDYKINIHGVFRDNSGHSLETCFSPFLYHAFHPFYPIFILSI